MTQQTKKFRLDQILIDLGLISDEQVKVALDLQKIYGGRFGSLLLHKGFIDEAGLVRALARQLGCNGVVLSKINIDDVVYRMIPQRVALARKIIPFDYDIDNNILKIACSDPTDQGLINELGFFVRGKKIKMYIAADIALNAAISKYYLGKEVILQDSIKLDLPEELLKKNQKQVKLADSGKLNIENSKPKIMIVSDKNDSLENLKNIFEADNYDVQVIESTVEAIRRMVGNDYEMILINESVVGDYIDFIERARKISPQTSIRYFESYSALVLNKDAIKSEGELLIRNLDLFSSLLSTKTDQIENHSGMVGKYVKNLCERLSLPDKDTVWITTAAYVHDLARHYYDTARFEGNHQEIQHTIKLLSSLNYSPVVIEILRSMYIDLEDRYQSKLPIEILGGNILTIIDLLCESIPQSDRLSIDKFEAINEKLKTMVGTLFLPEVIEAFVSMMQDEILEYHRAETGQILIYSPENSYTQPIENRLKNEGFRIIAPEDLDSFWELYERSHPDMMLLALPGTPDNIIRFIDDLEKKNIDFNEVSSFILVESICIPRITHLLERGIEDIIPFGENHEMLITKVKKIQSKIEARRAANATGRNLTGAKGSLREMNLIDLIQAMGPGQKTAVLTLESIEDTDRQLTIYLEKGLIIYAELGKETGINAVYEGLGWSDGYWYIEPIDPADLPEPNIESTNEAILMEGCRLLDEKCRA